MAQNPPNHGSPMLPQTTEGTTIGDYYANPGMRGGMNPGTGNHALQDYQMQLMLLEQQNKKRLMMARAEQDNLAQHGDNQRRMDQAFSQSMSPGSRAAPSPQPTGNPKMGGTPKMQNQVGPGSPLPDGQMSAGVPQRGSPASMGAFNGQMPDPHQNLMYQMKDMAMMGATQGGGASNGAMMPPRPNSHPAFNGQMSQADMSQMNQQMRGQQAGRGGPQAMSAAWQQQQAQVQAQAHVQAQQQQQQQQQQLQMHQVQQQQQQQQQSGGPQPPQVGTPQQARQSLTHQAMPPPSAPAAGATNNGRTQPSPPQVRDQPATPTQSHKAPPKTKGARDTGKKVSYHMFYIFLFELILNSNGQPRKAPAQHHRHPARVPHHRSLKLPPNLIRTPSRKVPATPDPPASQPVHQAEIILVRPPNKTPRILLPQRLLLPLPRQILSLRLRSLISLRT